VAKRARIEPYLQRLYGYAFSLAGDRHRAEDLVQECAIRALAAKNAPVDASPGPSRSVNEVGSWCLKNGQ
jgi:DNA-directed RNA polymerase specialized sigma24 family protein